MRLLNKLALITGGAGAIGSVIARRYLEEGASVILTGRNGEKLKQVCMNLSELDPNFKEKVHYLIMDGSNPESLRRAMPELKKLGRIDILVNNAGSSGPLQQLQNIPIIEEDLKLLAKEGIKESETLTEAVGSLLGSPWMTTCALLPILQKGASIINISTIFSKMDYFGRIAYVVPKAAVNQLGHLMSQELGKEPWCMRVNIVYPGPVESDRINRVFSAMDRLKDVEQGTTSKKFLEEMSLKSSDGKSAYLTKEEIANVIVFLGSSESSGLSDQDIEVTHAIQHVDQDTSSFSFNGDFTWILAGDDLESVNTLARDHFRKASKILLTFRTPQAAETAGEKIKKEYLQRCVKDHFNPENPDDWTRIIKHFEERVPDTIFVLPMHGAKMFDQCYGTSATAMPFEKIQQFLKDEIIDPICIAKGLSKLYLAEENKIKSKPSILFLAKDADISGNRLSKIRNEAIHHLIRTWRHENTFNNKRGAELSLNDDMQHKSLSVCDLNGKIAFITGGSEGIGRETARILLEEGVMVLITSRHQSKLEKARDSLIQSLIEKGVEQPEKRILLNVSDVTNPASIDSAFKEIEALGRIDYLINNAGITGQEQAISEMSLEGWKMTMQGNLISNYDLLIRSLPYMKKQKGGHIVCISSQLGGVGNATPSYPNRADYAVTKAGQRALSEALSSLLGPDVIINAIAPGPVEGDRLKGKEYPGLYERRAKTNFENKRLNFIYNAMISEIRKGMDCSSLLAILSPNRIESIEAELPSLRALLDSIPSKQEGGAYTHLLTKTLAQKLINRLKLSGKLPLTYDEALFFQKFEEAPTPFIGDEELTRETHFILDRTLRAHTLQRMPSEYDIGREIALNLTNRCMTGETLYLNCGYHNNNPSIRGNFLDYFDENLLTKVKAKTLFILGNSMLAEIVEIVKTFAQVHSVEKIVLLLGSLESEKKLRELLPDSAKVVIRSQALDNIDPTFNQAVLEFGEPDILISMPMGSLPSVEGQLPTLKEFNDFINCHITNHFQVVKRGMLIDHCKVFLITHSLQIKPKELVKSFAIFSQITLAPLCVTAAQEGARLAHQAVFYQLDENENGDSCYRNKMIDALLILSTLESEPAQSKEAKKFPLQSGTILIV